MKKYEEYKDSGVEWIGEIPMHWKVCKLKHVTKSIKSGGTHQNHPLMLSIQIQRALHGCNFRYVNKAICKMYALMKPYFKE